MNFNIADELITENTSINSNVIDCIKNDSLNGTVNAQTVSNNSNTCNIASTTVKNVNKCEKTENAFCGECVRKILRNDLYVTCNNCTLDFHFKCIDSKDVKLNNCWYCNNCFHKFANDELPFSNGFIDLKCKIRKGLKIAHLNIQGLIHKVDEVNLLLNDNDIDVFCINETWLSNDNDDSEIEIDGYCTYRLDRQNGKKRGGVLCYVKNSILSKQNNDLHDDDVEGIFIEINLTNTKPILVGSIYRPPDCSVDFLDNLDDVFKKCNNSYDDVYILGDFNLDQVKAGNLKKVTSLANNSNMKQIITDYTRITETSKTKIDLIFVSKPELIISSGVHSLGLSDHSLTYAVRKCNRLKLPPKIVKSRCFKNF